LPEWFAKLSFELQLALLVLVFQQCRKNAARLREVLGRRGKNLICASCRSKLPLLPGRARALGAGGDRDVAHWLETQAPSEGEAAPAKRRRNEAAELLDCSMWGAQPEQEESEPGAEEPEGGGSGPQAQAGADTSSGPAARDDGSSGGSSSSGGDSRQTDEAGSSNGADTPMSPVCGGLQPTQGQGGASPGGRAGRWATSQERRSSSSGYGPTPAVPGEGGAGSSTRTW
jgi:hypothetical protein